jgi:hypothetical protein
MAFKRFTFLEFNFDSRSEHHLLADTWLTLLEAFSNPEVSLKTRFDSNAG